MTKKLLSQAKMHPGIAALVAGIEALLEDHSNGRRDRLWLAERAGIPKTTLYRKLGNPGSLTADEVVAIAEALGVDVLGLYRIGFARLTEVQAA